MTLECTRTFKGSSFGYWEVKCSLQNVQYEEVEGGNVGILGKSAEQFPKWALAMWAVRSENSSGGVHFGLTQEMRLNRKAEERC